MPRKAHRITTRLFFAICLLCVFVFSATGCSLLDSIKQEPLTPLEKEQAERIYELSQHMHALLDEKYPDEGFDEGGPRSYDEQHLEFFFTAKKTKVTFVLRYEGDYLSEKLPEKIEGRIADVYSYQVLGDLYNEYVNEISTKYFSGTVAQFECYPSFSNVLDGYNGYGGPLPEKGSVAWNFESWDEESKEFLVMENLLNEKAPETILYHKLYYFKDIYREHADELYQEVYDFINHFKKKRFGKINLEVIVFPESLLTSAQMDKESFDGEEFEYSEVGKNNEIITFFSMWSSLDEFTDMKSMKDFIRVITVKEDNITEWIGGRKDGK